MDNLEILKSIGKTIIFEVYKDDEEKIYPQYVAAQIGGITVTENFICFQFVTPIEIQGDYVIEKTKKVNLRVDDKTTIVFDLEMDEEGEHYNTTVRGKLIEIC